MANLQDPDEQRRFALEHARPMGFIMLLMSVSGGALFIFAPIHEMRRGAAAVSISPPGILMAVMCLIFSTALLLGGRRFVNLMWAEGGRRPLTSALVFAFTIGLSALVFWGIDAWLHLSGYHVKWR